MKNKKHSFGKGLLIFFLVGVALITGALAVFWKYLGASEASLPEKAMKALLEEADTNTWEQVLQEAASNMSGTSFESMSEIMQNCFDAIRDGKVTYRKRSSDYTDEKPVYTVRIGGNDFAIVSLKQDQDVGFGMFTWAVDEISLAPEFIPGSRTITITAPSKAAVQLNGSVLGGEYVTETYISEELSELEKSFDDPLMMSVYTIAGIMDNVEVAVTDDNGNSIGVESADGSNFTAMLSQTPRDVTFQALEGTEINLNGVVISKDEYKSSEETFDLLNGAEDWIDAVPMIVTYTVPGIYAEELVVKGTNASGNEAIYSQSADGTYVFAWGDGEYPASNIEWLEAFLKTYLRYTANVDNQIDYNWSVIIPYLRNPGDAFSRLAQLREALIWNTSTKATLDEYSVEEYRVISDDCYIMRVNMKYTVTRTTGVTEEDATFDIVMVGSGTQYSVLEVGKFCQSKMGLVPSYSGEISLLFIFLRRPN